MRKRKFFPPQPGFGHDVYHSNRKQSRAIRKRQEAGGGRKTRDLQIIYVGNATVYSKAVEITMFNSHAQQRSVSSVVVLFTNSRELEIKI